MEMFRYGWSCIFLLLVFLVSLNAYSWMTPTSSCESSHSTAASTWTGLIPPMPELPQQYSMKVEANFQRKSKTVEAEEHYDNINKRASVAITRNGTTIVSLFNFTTNQRYDIYPNGTCITRPSDTDYLGFVGRDKKNMPVMATVNQVFRFGLGFNMTYVGKETVRGINVNHWTSCQSWDQFGASFQLDYYFSNPEFVTATGETEIPVRAVLNGSAGNPGSQGRHTFLHSYEFISFRAGSVLNEEVFEIPPGVVCKGRHDNRPLPPIPDQLEMSLEIVGSDIKMPPRQEHIIYDYNHKLSETVFSIVITESMVLPKIRSGEVKADNDNLMAITGSVVRDYSNGIIYVTETINMTCSVKKFASTTNLTMAHGQNLLTIGNDNSKFLYQGQRTARRMLVDVWGMEQNGITTEIYFLPKVHWNPFQSMVGMFIKNRTSDGKIDMMRIFKEVIEIEGKPWEDSNNKPQNDSSSQDKPKGPLITKITGDEMAWRLQLERAMDQYTSQKMINIFHYSPLHLDTTNFQVSHCYKEEETSQVMLVIQSDYYKDVLFNYVGFSNSLRSALAQRVGVSLLQISNLELTSCKLDFSKPDATKVIFTLLGAAPVQGISQRSLTDIKKDLLRSISNGISFHVQYLTHSKDFIVHKTIYELDYDTYNKPTKISSSFDDDVRGEGTRSEKTDTRYSPGAVTGIAIATMCLGVALSLGVLFLLFKWKYPGQPLIPYKNSTC